MAVDLKKRQTPFKLEVQLEGLFWVWGIVALIYAGRAVSVVFETQTTGLPVLFISNVVLGSIAFILSVWRIAGRSLPRLSMSLFFLLALVHEGTNSWLMGYGLDRPALWASLCFVMMALSFEGLVEEWSAYFLPLGSLMLLAPVWQAERTLHFQADILIKLAILPVLAVLAGQIIIWLKGLQSLSQETKTQVDELKKKSDHLFAALKKAQAEMRLQGALPKPLAKVANSVPFELEDTRSVVGEGMMHFNLESDKNFPYPSFQGREVFDVCLNVMERKKLQYAGYKGLTLAISRPQDLSLSLTVALDILEFEKILEALVDQGVSSLGGGPGVVRLTYRVGIREVVVSIEDNGRGLSEDLLRSASLRQGGAARLSYKEIRQCARDWKTRFEVVARLGVGTRVMFEIPRADAFRATRPRAFTGHQGSKSAPAVFEAVQS